MYRQERIAEAYERYRFVLAEKKIGMMPHHKKQKTDRLVSLAAHGMESQDRLRKFGHELMGDFRESAVGMMENIQESADRSEQFWNSIWREMRVGMENKAVRVQEDVKEIRRDIKRAAQGLTKMIDGSSDE